LSYTADDGAVAYLAADPPLAGLELTCDADGTPAVTIASPPDRCGFERTVPVRW